jgi:hypothetical protein
MTDLTRRGWELTHLGGAPGFAPRRALTHCSRRPARHHTGPGGERRRPVCGQGGDPDAGTIYRSAAPVADVGIRPHLHHLRPHLHHLRPHLHHLRPHLHHLRGAHFRFRSRRFRPRAHPVRGGGAGRSLWVGTAETPAERDSRTAARRRRARRTMCAGARAGASGVAGHEVCGTQAPGDVTRRPVALATASRPQGRVQDYVVSALVGDPEAARL